MTIGRINEIGVNQGNHSPGDAISLGRKVLKATIKNAPDSGSNAYVAWNEDASNKNVLEPGESATYYHDVVYLDGNALYIDFDSSNTGGRVLVSVIMDTEEEC